MKCHGWSATILRMVTHHSKDGHPPSKIYPMEEYYRLEIWNLDLTHKIKTRGSTMDFLVKIPRMVTHLPKDGHPPSKIKIYKNEVYYRLGIWHIDFIMKLRTGDNCHGWLTTIP